MQKLNKDYEIVSQIYSHLMKKVRYDFWADYLYMLTQEYVSKRANVLELGAGHCSLAHHLKEYYKKIIPTDLSFQMLNSSKDKKLKRVCCNMTSLPFQTSFDLIFSCFDSVNYLIRKKDINNLFSNVSSLLSDKGIFTFDVSLENNSKVHIKEPIREGKYKGVIYKHFTSFNKKKRIHRNEFEIQLKNKKNYREVHKQKIYLFFDYFRLLQKNGLYVVECFNAFTFYDADENSKRVQFIVKKTE